MILSFKGKRIAVLFWGLAVRGLSPRIAQRAFDKLRLLHAVPRPGDLPLPPSNRLEGLKHNRRDQWNIRINDQWHICFRFDAGNEHDVEVADYH